jgi:hypothetical protein
MEGNNTHLDWLLQALAALESPNKHIREQAEVTLYNISDH